jgi:microcystin-dependent protein
MMAATAKYRDDIAGAIVTSGSATAYTVSSYQSFDSLPHMDGQMIGFTPHTTNGATVTLNVDGLGARPLRTAPNAELLAGTIIQGTPYVAIYNSSDGAFYLRGFYGNPFSIPLAGGLDYWGLSAPNSAFAFPVGQAISRTTYALLFALVGTTYGGGDGTSTFNLPDKRGRVSAMKEDSASWLTSTYFGASSTTLGARGGNESHALTVGEMPTHSHANSLNETPHVHGTNKGLAGLAATSGLGGASGGIQYVNTTGENTSAASTGISINNASAGGGLAHAIVQPTIICNYIMRVL